MTLVLPRIAGYFESCADLGNATERAELSSAAIKAFMNQSRALLGGWHLPLSTLGRRIRRGRSTRTH
jgi:hypothetical protein